MPAVSVILPTCDRPRLVPRALASLLAQTWGDFEILLVDAGRREPPVTANPALAPALADPRVRVLDGRATRNAAMARNTGLRAARGDWVTFLDDDDEYQPDKLASQHALAHATGAPLVVCGYEFVWPRRRRVRQTERDVFRGDEILTRAFLGSPVLFHRREPGLFFDEGRAAGEDMPYAVQFICRHRIRALPNVPRPLVTVHPQPAGKSVHADKASVWQSYRATASLGRADFSREARHAFLARGRLERAMGGHGDWSHFLGCALAVLRTGGTRQGRFLGYALLARVRSRRA